jgi:hypothetical protein
MYPYNSTTLEAEIAHRRAALDSAGRWTPSRRGSWFGNRNRRRSR